MVTLDEVLYALAALVEDIEIINAETGQPVTVEEVATFAALGILSSDPGLAIRLSDGRAVALTLNDYGGWGR